jgi:hypothetical protein
VTDTTTTEIGAEGDVDRRGALLWALIGFVVVFFVGSFLHFSFELSGYQIWVAAFSAVNESAWEHLKMFYFPAAVLALVQHAFLRGRVNNYWYAVGAGLLIVPSTILASFYLYLGIILPIRGRGTLTLDIATAVVGVALAQWVTYRLWVGTERPQWRKWTMLGANVALLVAMLAFTAYPPDVFLFEDFYGYRYNDQFGILDSYVGREVFVDA